jgi:hypothetical protein
MDRPSRYIGGCWRGPGRSSSELARAAHSGEGGLRSRKVQIIESTPFGVRSSVMTFGRPDSNVRFLLFPMLHLGTPEFYADVAQRLAQCDLILAEGVAGRRTSLITLSYRLAGKVRRFGLMEQGRGLQLRTLGVPVENVDATASQFSRSWRRAPRYARLLLLALAPLFGLWLIASGSRSMIAQQTEVNDLPDRDEAFMPDSLARVQDAIVHDRDRLLCDAIAREAGVPVPSTKTVAILWGAGHMPAVVHYLMGPLRYRVLTTEWVTVFVP